VPEIYDPTANTWTLLPGARLDVGGNYPQSYIVPNGKIFMVAGPDGKSRTLDVGTQTWATIGSAPAPFGTSTMDRPGKMISGVGDSVGGGDPIQSATAVIDMNQSSPTWRQTAPMAYARDQHNLVLLPDGKVLAVGGSTLSSLTSTSGVLP